MDRVLRTYAHTAWTPSDPLAGLDPEVRRAILLMPSTFRERWKLAPWTSRHHRRLAIADIVAERRLLYELTCQKLDNSAPTVTAAPAPVAPAEPASPYYRYRLALHRQALEAMHDVRADQERSDLARVPEAKADHELRQARRQALLAVELERARLDVREIEILTGRDASDFAAAPPATRRATPSKRRAKDRGR